MELDFKYKQHLIGLNELLESENSEKNLQNKPYQELIDYFEANKTNFYHADFIKNIVTPLGNTEIILSDGTKVLIGNGNDVINVAIQYPNKTKFIGMWTKLPNSKEFIEKSKEIAKS